MGRTYIVEVREQSDDSSDGDGDSGGGCRWVLAGVLGLLLVFVVYAVSQSAKSDSVQATTEPTFSIQSLKEPQFQVGDQVVVILPGRVHVRRTPGYKNKPVGDDVCGGTQTGERFQIIGGPQQVDTLWWWKVSNSRCEEGWIAQNQSTGDAILARP